jgi:hypothetical protein
VELFEEIRRGCAAGETILGLAKKHDVQRRMVRQALANAVPPERKKQERVPLNWARSGRSSTRSWRAIATRRTSNDIQRGGSGDGS